MLPSHHIPLHASLHAFGLPHYHHQRLLAVQLGLPVPTITIRDYSLCSWVSLCHQAFARSGGQLEHSTVVLKIMSSTFLSLSEIRPHHLAPILLTREVKDLQTTVRQRRALNLNAQQNPRSKKNDICQITFETSWKYLQAGHHSLQLHVYPCQGAGFASFVTVQEATLQLLHGELKDVHYTEIEAREENTSLRHSRGVRPCYILQFLPTSFLH